MVKIARIIKKDKKITDKKRTPKQAHVFVKALTEESYSLSKVIDDINVISCNQLYEDALAFIKKIMDKQDFFDVNEAREIVMRMSNLLNKKETADILLGLALTGDSIGENYLYTHSVNVAILALRLAKALGYGRVEQMMVGLGALFHDIGMLKIPEEIRNKPGPLSIEEFEIIAGHPAKGYEWLKKIKDIEQVVCDIVYQHHERVNGKGYPQKLTDGQIYNHAQIIGLVDAYEARIHSRRWRRAILPDEAISDILDKDKNAYDPSLVKLLLKEVSIYPLCTWVKLNTKEIARVIKINPGLPLRPVVEVVFDANGEKLKEPKVLDLTKQPLVYIEESCTVVSS